MPRSTSSAGGLSCSSNWLKQNLNVRGTSLAIARTRCARKSGSRLCTYLMALIAHKPFHARISLRNFCTLSRGQHVREISLEQMVTNALTADGGTRSNVRQAILMHQENLPDSSGLSWQIDVQPHKIKSSATYFAAFDHLGRGGIGHHLATYQIEVLTTATKHPASPQQSAGPGNRSASGQGTCNARVICTPNRRCALHRGHADAPHCWAWSEYAEGNRAKALLHRTGLSEIGRHPPDNSLQPG